MEANTGPLLKVYYENCPGCKQDRKNEVRRGVPYREFFYIWIVTLCSALPVASLFPFLYFMNVIIIINIILLWSSRYHGCTYILKLFGEPKGLF
ncbi:unnamed protein product [Musa acuminata subsp. malaccensis]|uniref:(wild Malaysian banana) hypothetical protein n=1 Tax=Musa acuminata subsp. malaccensis TaxID=214687 RepID=A0A804K9J4_MUSAM|nr:unnamed protein product [Musa acuminata subsp. malaccensis]